MVVSNWYIPPDDWSILSDFISAAWDGHFLMGESTLCKTTSRILRFVS